MNTTLFRWPVRVYFEDTDAGGVVYHASYVAYYERARTELLRNYRLSQHVLLQKQIAFVVRRLAIEYLSPARLDDLLEIQSEVVAISRTTITFAQRIVNEEGKVLNEAEVLIACIDPQRMKPVAMPGSIAQELKP